MKKVAWLRNPARLVVVNPKTCARILQTTEQSPGVYAVGGGEKMKKAKRNVRRHRKMTGLQKFYFGKRAHYNPRRARGKRPPASRVVIVNDPDPARRHGRRRPRHNPPQLAGLIRPAGMVLAGVIGLPYLRAMVQKFAPTLYGQNRYIGWGVDALTAWLAASGVERIASAEDGRNFLIGSFARIGQEIFATVAAPTTTTPTSGVGYYPRLGLRPAGAPSHLLPAGPVPQARFSVLRHDRFAPRF